MGIDDLFGRTADGFRWNPPPSPTDVARRGSGTHLVILLEIMRATGTAPRLFAEMPLQSRTVLARVTRLRTPVKKPAATFHPHFKTY